MKKTAFAYRRVLLKISGEALAGKQESGIDFTTVNNICKEIAPIVKAGLQVAIVVGGGNFWRYRDFKDSGLDRVHSDYLGMLATVFNARALEHGFKQQKLKVKVFSAITMPQVAESYIRDKALEELEEGTVVICAGGTGRPFFTTDTTAALRALELNCNVLLKATNVDYVYDQDPHTHKKAHHFSRISYDEVLERGLGVMDLSAISLCREATLPIRVFNLHKSGNIVKIVGGEKIGTEIF